MPERDKWWGEFTIEFGAAVQWEIGPMQLAVQRLPGEWVIVYKTTEMVDDQQKWRVAYSDQDPGEIDADHVARFIGQDSSEQLTVLPALADRSVVSRPFTPFTVPANEKASIYVSTPLWFTLVTGAPGRPLFEIPIQRPSDTWFGPSTREGETCYASRTFGRLHLENLTIYQHRAITQVHINNRAAIPLLVERINLPVPFLSLFHTPHNIFWTETVTMVQTGGVSLAEFHIGKEPPPEAADAALAAKPRRIPQKGMLIRAFSVLKLQGSG